MENYNQQYSDYTIVGSQTGQVSKTFMANVFLWMFVALGVSAICAYLFASNESLLSYLINPSGKGLNILGWAVIFAPLVFVLVMSAAYNRLSSPALIALFMLYAAVNGISFSFILLAYTAGSVMTCFLSASAMFGIMAVLGYTTDKDLTSFGRIMMMGLIGIVVASLLNWLFKSPGLNYIISIVGVMVFTGLTAYDVQKLKQIGQAANTDAEGVKKMSVIGALNLYLDFINLFLMLLRLFGNKRD